LSFLIWQSTANFALATWSNCESTIFAGLRAGDPFDPETTLAPLSSQGAADDLRDLIRQAVVHGAKATEVGPNVPNQGAFVQPTILTDIGENNPARYWEFFGPVSMLFRAKDENDAVRIANDSPFGLGGSVFTTDPKRGAEVAKRISTGMVFVNHPTKVEADLPFGGIRRSGYGREGETNVRSLFGFRHKDGSR
jgi:succinate-semialdehyde dehydrogenase / glutarate-semialdehyde dehydrogenase